MGIAYRVTNLVSFEENISVRIPNYCTEINISEQKKIWEISLLKRVSYTLYKLSIMICNLL